MLVKFRFLRGIQIPNGNHYVHYETLELSLKCSFGQKTPTKQRGVLQCMSLVDYSASSSDEDSSCVEETLPYEGRLRSVPHREGYWAFHVYIPIDLDESLLYVPKGWTRLTNYHISLSRTVYLPQFQLNPMDRALREAFSSEEFPSFSVILQNSVSLENDEKSCSFLALGVHDGCRELMSLVNIIDDVLKRFALPEFYNPPCFHCSYAWRRNAQTVASEEAMLMESFPTSKLRREISRIDFRMGHLRYSIDLSGS